VIKQQSLAFAREVYRIWVEERPAQLAAALAYYGMFSFVPLIFIAITMAGLFLEGSALTDRVFTRLEIIFGPEAIEFMRQMFNQIGQTHVSGSWLATLISFLAILYIASGLFFQLNYALNKIWNAPQPEKAGLIVFLKKRALLFVMVIGVGLLIVLVTLVNLVISWLSSHLRFAGYVPLVSLGVQIGLFVASFAMIYKLLPDVQIAWRDVWIGAVITTLLVLLGGVVIGIYFRISNVGSAFQTAGAFAVILIGFYYLAQIFLLGAILTRVYSSMYGSKRSDSISPGT